MKFLSPSSGSSFSSFIFSTSILVSFSIVRTTCPGSDLKLQKQQLEAKRIKTMFDVLLKQESPDKSSEALGTAHDFLQRGWVRN